MIKKAIQTEILEPLGVPAFVDSKPICILRVRNSSQASLPSGLVAHFSKTSKAGEVGVGYLNLASVDLENWFVKSYVQARRNELGWSKGNDIPEGYYLFFDRRLVAFHDGKPDLLSDGVTQMAMFGGLFSIIADSKLGEDMAKGVAESRGVRSMLASFEEKLKWARLSRIKIPSFASAASQQEQKRPRRATHTRRKRKRTTIPNPPHENDVLQKAYATLGVSVNSTDQEIKDARKKLIRTWHPDRFQKDTFFGSFPEEHTKKINQSFDLIMNSREKEQS